MPLSSFRSAIFTALIAVFISSCHSQNYASLDALGVNCPSKDSCKGYKSDLPSLERSCECDDDCTAYKDCCIDALPDQATEDSRPSPRTDVTCLPYGGEEHAGVYVINTCSSTFSEPRVIEKCLGSDDFSDPLFAAPATDVAQNKTYRNLACARCNNADLASLKTFGLRFSCYGLVEKLTQEQLMADMTYNQEQQLWGVNRLNRFENATEFIGCEIIYDVPGYLNNSVRFCRSNLISTCASNWTRPAIARLCSQYMAVVYNNTDFAFRNPHCAICNHEIVNENTFSCTISVLGGRRPKPPRPWSFAFLLDFNRGDGVLTLGHLVDVYVGDGVEEVGLKRPTTPECPSDQKYDPIFKKCRRLVCVLPGYFVREGKCRKGL